MERDRNQVRQEIEETKAAMAAKLDEITERVEGARSRISHMRSTVSVHHQVEERPWTMMGLSVVAGFALYRIVHARRTEQAVSRALEKARGPAEHAARSAKGAAYTAAEKARSGAESVRETVRERVGERSFSRSAFDTVTRAAASSLGAALARTIVERVIHRQQAESEFLGERGEERPYEGTEFAAPTAPRVPGSAEQRSY